MTLLDRFVASAFALGVIAAALGLTILCAVARDNGQWAQADPTIGPWVARQKQPDTLIGCCGDADMYYADSVSVEDGKVFAIITDERDDAPLRRWHRDIGTRVEIPPNKNNKNLDDPNPTGHGVVFIASDGRAICYFPPGGF